MVKVLGVTDEVTTCELCGKSKLKCTVVIDLGDGSEPVHYGRDCAGMVKYGKKSSGNTAKVVREFEDAKREEEAKVRRAAKDAEFARWDAFLKAHGTGAEVFTRIQSLGGFKAARAMYDAQQ
jgi:hypothetical protein